MSVRLKGWKTVLRHDVRLFVLVVVFSLGGRNNPFSPQIKLRSVCNESEVFCLQTLVVRRLSVQCCQSFPDSSGEMFLADDNSDTQTSLSIKKLSVSYMCIECRFKV